MKIRRFIKSVTFGVMFALCNLAVCMTVLAAQEPAGAPANNSSGNFAGKMVLLIIALAVAIIMGIIGFGSFKRKCPGRKIGVKNALLGWAKRRR